MLIYIQIFIVKLLFPKYWSLPTALIYAQAYHETGNFSSAIYKENNNLFGMKEPSVRKTTATGTNRGHATFKSRISSIYDYFLRQSYFNINYNNDAQYIEDTVNSGYAEDQVYLQKWVQIYNDTPKHYKILAYIFCLGVLALPVVLYLHYAKN